MAEERPLFFESASGSHAGILTLPSVPPLGTGILLAWGSGAYPSSGRNRVRTRLARRLADDGYHVLRFDYGGVGESTGEYTRRDLGSPFVDEIVAAERVLVEAGATQTIVVANCFGGWSSVVAAAQLESLAAIAVIGAPVRRDHSEVRGADASLDWWLRRARKMRLNKLRDPRRRALYLRMVAARARPTRPAAPRRRKSFSAMIEAIIGRNIPVLLVYGDDDFAVDLDAELAAGLQSILDAAGANARLVRHTERLQGLASLESQRILTSDVLEWLGALRGGVVAGEQRAMVAEA